MEGAEYEIPATFSEDMQDLWNAIDPRSATLIVAGLSMILATQICMNLIGKHIKFWTNPREQKAIIAIICMVPIFAIDSYIGLVEMPALEIWSTLLDAIKECYEAFVIASFLDLMYSYMGVSTKKGAPIPDAIKGRKLHHSWPVTMFQPREVRVDWKTLDQLGWWTWQFVIIRPVFSIAILVLEALGLYKPPLTYVFTVVFNLSVFLAMYTLLLFYHGFAKELAPHRPMAKFLCIKGVVFFAYWQGLVLSILASTGVLHEGHFPFSVKQIEEAIQNFLVCIEMVVFAYFYTRAFRSSEYSLYSPDAQNMKRVGDKKKEL